MDLLTTYGKQTQAEGSLKDHTEGVKRTHPKSQML